MKDLNLIRLLIITGFLRNSDGKSVIIRNMIEYLINHNYEVHLICDFGSKIDLTTSEKFKVYKIDSDVTKRNLLSFFSLIKLISKICNKNQIDIIHTHHRYHELVANIIRMFTKVKTVTTVHAFVEKFGLLSFKSDKIIFVSDHQKIEMEKKFSSLNARGMVISNGIDINDNDRVQKVKTKLKNKKDQINLLYVGRIDFEKGTDILLEAVIKIEKDFKNIQLTIIGEFSPIFSKYSKNNKQNFHDKISYLLSQTKNFKIKETESIPWEEYYISDIVIIPSRIETFSLVAVEAAYAKCKIICSNIEAFKAILKNDGAIYFNNNDSNDLYKKMLRTINSPNEFVDIGSNAFKNVNKKFTNSIMMNRYEKLYKNLISEI